MEEHGQSREHIKATPFQRLVDRVVNLPPQSNTTRTQAVVAMKARRKRKDLNVGHIARFRLDEAHGFDAADGCVRSATIKEASKVLRLEDTVEADRVAGRVEQENCAVVAKMIRQILADREFLNQRNAVISELLTQADPREHEKLR